MKILVCLEPKHIKRGHRSCGATNPIALAMKDAGIVMPVVCEARFWYGVEPHRRDDWLPGVARDWNEKYHARWTVGAFEVEVEGFGLSGCGRG